MPKKLTLAHFEAAGAPVAAASRQPLRFLAPMGLARLAEEGSVPLFAPGSSFGVLSVDGGLAAATLMMTVALSCAREGATILYASGRTSLSEFAAKASMGEAKCTSGSIGPSRADVKRLASLDIYHMDLQEHTGPVGEEGLSKAIQVIDADLVVLEDAAVEDVAACLAATEAAGVPMIYNQCCSIDEQHVARCDMHMIPSHMLIMDRSLTEEEAELPERPDWGTCECWLLLPDARRGIANLPFLGTFTLSFLPCMCFVKDYIDTYGGHLLYGNLDAVMIGEDILPVVKPERYGKRLELLYGER